ncbi:MAG: MarR family transcriptional regulator [Croceibacterium sp.]
MDVGDYVTELTAANAYDAAYAAEFRLTALLVMAARRWRALLDERLRPSGQSSARMEALSAIANSPAPRSQIDIAKRLRIEGPTITRMIDSLAADGLVERQPAPTDRRTKHLTLTAAGEAALADIFATARPLRARFLREIDPAEADMITEVLSRMLARLDRGFDDEPAGDRS